MTILCMYVHVSVHIFPVIYMCIVGIVKDTNCVSNMKLNENA